MKVIDSKILLTVTEKCDGECMIKFGNLVTPLEPKQYYWKAKVVSVGAIHVEPLGIYGGKQTSLDIFTK